MNTVKNIHKIEHLLSEDARKKLEHGASLHKRHARIEFKVKSANDKLVIRATQGKSPAGNYLDKKTLIARTRELFGHFIKGKDIVVHASPYQQPPPEVVDPSWIQKQMLEKGVKLVDLAKDTGVHHTTLSTYINGGRPLSQPVKSMFYYYFKSKDSKKTA